MRKAVNLSKEIVGRKSVVVEDVQLEGGHVRVVRGQAVFLHPLPHMDVGFSDGSREGVWACVGVWMNNWGTYPC